MTEQRWIREIEPAEPGTSEKPGSGPTYRSIMVPQGQDFKRLPEVTTLYDSFARSARIYAERPALGFRTTTDGVPSAYQWLSYAETAQQAADLGACLMAAGLKPRGRVGIFGANSPQWMLAMQVNQSKPGSSHNWPHKIHDVPAYSHVCIILEMMLPCEGLWNACALSASCTAFGNMTKLYGPDISSVTL